MLLRINPETPDKHKVKEVANYLKAGGIIILPTDTVYALSCDMNHRRAVQRICQIKNIKLEKATFSILCEDLSTLSEYTSSISKEVFKVLKRNIPGPFTFILQASKKVPKIFNSKRKSIGIRVPDNEIARAIIKEFGSPIVTTSLHDDDEIIDYTTDPELLFDKYKDLVDVVIDGGYGGNQPSAVIDCTQDELLMIREGAKELI